MVKFVRLKSHIINVNEIRFIKSVFVKENDNPYNIGKPYISINDELSEYYDNNADMIVDFENLSFALCNKEEE